MTGTAPRLVLVTGLPGTGKTTVGQRIADHFRWPFITKDRFKELIFDGLGWSDKAWSLKVSATVHRIMDYVIEEELKAGRSIVVEGNFKAEIDSARFRDIQARHGVVLGSSPVLGARRCVVRALQEPSWDRPSPRPRGNRKPGSDGAEPRAGTCEPLQLHGKMIEVNTTDFAGLDYETLFASIS